MNAFRLPAAILGAAVLATALAAGAQPIKVGELNSYKQFPAFLEPYKKGMELAQEEINAAGGVLGRAARDRLPRRHRQSRRRRARGRGAHRRARRSRC